MWKVVDAVVPDQGDATAKPMPAPNASRIRVTAPAATPPASMAPHDTAERSEGSVWDGTSRATSVSTAMYVAPSRADPVLGCQRSCVFCRGPAYKESQHQVASGCAELGTSAHAYD